MTNTAVLRPPVVRHDLRVRSFGLLPEEDAAEWAAHLAEVRAGLRPVDPLEDKLVAAFAVALWREIRADRIEADVLAEIPPLPGRSHGGDLQERHHAAALVAALRYGAAAGMAVTRAQRALYAHRKARKDELLPAAPQEPEPPHAEPPHAETLGRPVASGGAAAMSDEEWVKTVPVVEADPEREARRRVLLLEVEPPELRRAIGHAPLAGIEQYLLPDMAAYEQWFARQPKPERVPARSLTAEDAALVAHVTRHNPPWFKGEYLSYWRKPVPPELLDRPGTRPEPEPAAPATIATPLADLRARLARLLDRTAPRRPDEIDLAEAVCAVRWPNWGPYRGPLDLDLLRRALDGHVIDGRTLTWLDSHAFAKACRAGEG